MKILVLSDSHSDLGAMQRALAQYAPDCVIHLGDHYRDSQALRQNLGPIPLYAVPGNCDYGTNAAQTLQFSLCGMRFFITHGHRHGVKFSPLRAVLAAQEAGANILCFGHTHQQLYQMHSGLHVINPGACSGGRPKCALITIEDGAVTCALCEIGGDRHDPCD